MEVAERKDQNTNLIISTKQKPQVNKLQKRINGKIGIGIRNLLFVLTELWTRERWDSDQIKS